MSGLYGIWCPVCKAEINSVTRGIPSMGICKNGHKTDRRDCLYREPDTITDPAAIRADALSDPRVVALVEAAKKLRHSVCGPTGFADAVRHNSGQAYPWPSLDAAELALDAALRAIGGAA